MSQPVPVPGREQALGGATGRTLEEHYELLEVLGRGSFSVVHRARHRQTGELFACKVIDKWSIHNRQRLANEVRAPPHPAARPSAPACAAAALVPRAPLGEAARAAGRPAPHRVRRARRGRFRRAWRGRPPPRRRARARTAHRPPSRRPARG